MGVGVGGGGGGGTVKIVISWGLEWEREGGGGGIESKNFWSCILFFIKWTLRKHKSFIIRGWCPDMFF